MSTDSKTFKTGFPTFTWPEWRKAPRGTWFRHNQSGKTGVYIQPAKSKHNGAIVLWDERMGRDDKVLASVPGASYVVAPARELTPIRMKAWDMIGFDGNLKSVWINDEFGPDRAAQVRIKGGRALYEAVTYYDDTLGTQVKLSYLRAGSDGIHQVDRWVDPDTELEIVVQV